MDVKKKIGLSVTGLAIAAVTGGALLFGASNAVADPSTSPSDASSTSAPRPGGPRGNHTEASADETTKVTDAVKAQFPDVTIEKVMKDEDGSFDVAATKADGTRVHYDVSADYATVTEKTRGPGGKGPRGNHTEASADETSKATDAVKAQFPDVTVVKVMKDEDGSFDVAATKADGSRVGYDVSADYATVTEKTGGPGGPGGKGPGGNHTEATADETTKVTDAVKAQFPDVTIKKVMKDEDGSFDVKATDASGNRVHYEVSADYSTVTAR